MRTNIKNHVPAPRTHEGAVAKRISAEDQLRRSVMACLLWEGNFYEDGQDIAARIKDLVGKVNPTVVNNMAIEARTDMKLRHAPLLLARELARLENGRHLLGSLLPAIIQRADELAEFVSIYWKEGKQPLANSVKRGLAEAFRKFDEYSLAKYNRDSAVKLRDVLFLCHAKPENKAQEKLWKRLVNGTLATPDTWEVALSATKGESKKEAWERLLREGKMAPLAFIRNLRNFENEGVDRKLVRQTFATMKVDRLLPYNFVTAARFCPQYEPELEVAMMKCMEGKPKLAGKTVLLVDVSGSMSSPLSGKSETTCLDAAAGLAILAREVCEEVEIYTFCTTVEKVPARRGFALRDAVGKPRGGTDITRAVEAANRAGYDRLIVFTDEQSGSYYPVPDPIHNGYMVNISTNQNGIGYKTWTHVDGFSEHILKYIYECEQPVRLVKTRTPVTAKAKKTRKKK
jgi:60 kDa SS-A/Ro ribonucleoprotein